MKLYEEFDKTTLRKNIDTYNKYLSRNKREEIVAWDRKNSQKENFELVSDKIEPNSSVLDFGCGIGDFIKHLDEKGKTPSDYLGVDINNNFINIAKNDYPDYNFKTINSINTLNNNFDYVCAIGVFTWYITKEEFINTINKLYELSNKKLLITVLYLDDLNIENYDWEGEYRYYNQELFKELFPNYNINFKIKRRYGIFSHLGSMLVEFTK